MVDVEGEVVAEGDGKGKGKAGGGGGGSQFWVIERESWGSSEIGIYTI